MLALFKTLRHHRRLAEQRMVDPEKNRIAIYLGYFAITAMVLYLMFLAVLFALIANNMRAFSTPEFLTMMMPVIIIIDFSMRFIAQQTPAQMIKPYLLLPLKRKTLIQSFLISQMMNASNLIWMALVIPYCVMSVIFAHGIMTAFSLVVLFWLTELVISQFYLITRTLAADNILWWAMPVSILVIALLPGADWHKTEYIFTNFTEFYNILFAFESFAHLGAALELHRLWPLLLVTLILIVLFVINRHVQLTHVMSEITKTNAPSVVTATSSHRLAHISSLMRLNRGPIATYLTLELLTIMRNKNPRRSMRTAIIGVLALSAVIIFTDVYDNAVMRNFWCLYNYEIFGAVALTQIMSAEGNYADLLLTHKENIYQLLRAKYFFYTSLLIIPFVLMMPTVISGKWSFWMVLSYGIFSCGLQYYALFQLAPYNTTTMPLNTKLTTIKGVENNKWQVFAQLAAMFLPLLIVTVIQLFLGDTLTYITMSVIGLLFILTHKRWIHTIYSKFMARRYHILEGFRKTR